MTNDIIRKESILVTMIRAFQKLISNPKAPEHGASYIAPYGVRQPFSPETSMSAYSGHAYTNACATRASQDLAALPIVLMRGRGANAERVEDHAFYDLLEQPSSFVDGFLFREQILVDLILSGNCYVLITGSLSSPSSLFRLHPDNVEIITDQNRGIVGYKYTDGGQSVQYPVERILHTRNASWKSGAGGELYGTGAIESLSREINIDINATKLASELSSQGRPDVLLSPKDDADIWGKERRREILDSYRNMTDKGGAIVLSGQVDVKTLNLTPREMEFQAAREMARENISAVMGVPSTILGLPDANYATARQSTIIYWDIQSKRGRKMELLFTQIAKMFDSSLRVEIDYSGVDALQDLRTSKLERIEKHILIGGMPASEAYAYEGLTDSPLKATEEEVQEEEERAIHLARFFHEMETKAKEDELAKVGNKREAFEQMPAASQKGVENKAKEHNEEYGDDPKRKTTKFTLAVVWWRGIGAYKNNPASVRPSVKSPEQWAMARVNSYLYALRNQKYRSGKHDTDLLPEDHDMNPKKKLLEDYEIRGSVGDRNPTNFPEDGDNKEVALRNSQYARFPWKEAQDLKEEWPEIWRKGGNILGNTQFNRLKPIAERASSIARTETEERAIRLREAWAARHEGDFRLAGVVAQIKWLVVGSRGLAHMRAVISEAKQKLSKKSLTKNKSQEERSAYWHNWIAKKVEPTEKAFERVAYRYLTGAKGRYLNRLSDILKEARSFHVQETRAINWTSLLASAAELRIMTDTIGRFYNDTWILSGNEAIDDIYGLLEKNRPLDLRFGDRRLMEREMGRFIRNIDATTRRKLQKLVRRGIEDGLSNDDIAKTISDSGAFAPSRARMIAQTETTSAINQATNEAYRQIEKEEDIKILKQWISSNDDRVREEHQQLDGKIVPASEDFTVGSYSGSAPAGFGAPEMDINCRCTIAPIVQG